MDTPESSHDSRGEAASAAFVEACRKNRPEELFARYGVDNIELGNIEESFQYDPQERRLIVSDKGTEGTIGKKQRRVSKVYDLNSSTLAFRLESALVHRALESQGVDPEKATLAASLSRTALGSRRLFSGRLHSIAEGLLETRSVAFVDSYVFWS